jgi:hypothetical protein
MVLMLSRTQRHYLEHAVRCQGGELRWGPRANGGGSIFRMIHRLAASGFVAFDPKRMAWMVTKTGRAALEEGARVSEPHRQSKSGRDAVR